MSIELRHLRYFIAVVDAAGVARAARRLNISQPTLSRQVHDLEADLGLALFNRIGRRLVLTVEGEELLGRGRHLLAEVESLHERAQVLAGGKSGVLRVGAPSQIVERVLPPVLAQHRRRHPAVEVRLVDAGTDRLLTLVQEGALHLAVGVWRDAEHLERRLLYPLCLVAVMSHRHRLARRPTVSVADLAGEPVFLLERGFEARRLLDQSCSAERVELRVVLESRAPGPLVALAERGEGIAIVPSVAQFRRARARVLPLLRQGKPIGAWARVVWDGRRYLPPYAEDMIRALTTRMKTSYPGRELHALRLVPRPAELVRPARLDRAAGVGSRDSIPRQHP
jgi:LysR family cyn operon transcriptional activator